jgi:hypothetical protein
MAHDEFVSLIKEAEEAEFSPIEESIKRMNGY